MADNITTSAGVLSTRERNGAHLARYVPAIVDGSTATDVDGANPMPVTGPLTNSQLRAEVVSVADAPARDAIAALSGAEDFFAITPANTNLTTVPDGLYVAADGNLEVRGTSGTVTIPVVAGQLLPFKPTQVRTGTTATVIGLVA